MTDFEIMVARLRDEHRCAYIEGIHFEISEWEIGIKTIKMRPSTLADDWIYFDYDENGKFIEIY